MTVLRQKAWKTLLCMAPLCLVAPHVSAVPTFTAPVPVHLLDNSLQGTGTPIVIQGNTLAVTGQNGSDFFVYVFLRQSGVWIETAKLGTSDKQVQGFTLINFGMSLAISPDGNTLFVGDPTAACPTNESDPCGQVLVYQKPAGGWASTNSPSARLRSTVVASEELGLSLAISSDGSTLATKGDTAYVFVKPAGAWADAAPTAVLGSASGIGNSGAEGNGVSVDGDVVAVNGVGVYVKPTLGWSDMASGTAGLGGGPASILVGDFGSSLAVVGDEILVGAAGTFTAFLYQKPGGGWASTNTPDAQLQAPASPVDFGSGINMIGTTAVVGDGNTLHLYDQPVAGWSSEPATSDIVLATTTYQAVEGRNVIWVSGNELAATAGSHCEGAGLCIAGYVLSSVAAGTNYDGLVIGDLSLADVTRHTSGISSGFTGDTMNLTFDVRNSAGADFGTATFEATLQDGVVTAVTAKGTSCSNNQTTVTCRIALAPGQTASVTLADQTPADRTSSSVTAGLKDISPRTWDPLNSTLALVVPLTAVPVVPKGTTVFKGAPGQPIKGVLPVTYIGKAPLQFSILTGNVGALELNESNGHFTWTPPIGPSVNPQSYTYQVSDGVNVSQVGTVELDESSTTSTAASSGGGGGDLGGPITLLALMCLLAMRRRLA